MKMTHKRQDSKLKLRVLSYIVTALIFAFPATSKAGVIFSFQDSGGNVTMTSSGSLDTSLLVGTAHFGWNGTGFGTFTSGGGTRDMIGSTSSGATDLAYLFSAGTDVSAWDGGSFIGGANFFGFTDSGTTQFSTYAAVGGTFFSGIALSSADLVGSIWTPDSSWLATGTSIAALGLISGSYTITDASTGEFITIAIGDDPISSVPEPATLALMGLGLLGMTRLRRNAK